jgi:hypothetical protein
MDREWQLNDSISYLRYVYKDKPDLLLICLTNGEIFCYDTTQDEFLAGIKKNSIVVANSEKFAHFDLREDVLIGVSERGTGTMHTISAGWTKHKSGPRKF